MLLRRLIVNTLLMSLSWYTLKREKVNIKLKFFVYYFSSYRVSG